MSELVLNPIECDKILSCILLFSIHCFVSLSSYYEEEDCSYFALEKTILIIVEKEENEREQMFLKCLVIQLLFHTAQNISVCQFSQVVTTSTSTSPFQLQHTMH